MRRGEVPGRVELAEGVSAGFWSFWLPLVQGGGAGVVLLPLKWIATLRAGSQSIRRCRFVRDVELLLAFLVRSLPALPDRGPGSRLVG